MITVFNLKIMEIDIKNILTYQAQKLVPSVEWFKFSDMASKLPPPPPGGVTIPGPSKPPDPNAGAHLNLENIYFENMFFIDSDLLLDDTVQMSALPENERIIILPYTNQLDAQQTITVKDTYKKITGWKAEFAENIQNSEMISGNINFKMNYEAISVGGGSSYEHKIVKTTSYSRVINETKEETFEVSMPFNIPPKQKVEIKTGYRNSYATRKFSGFVKIESDIKIRYGNEWVFAEKTKKLSLLLPDEARSFYLNGYYTDIEYKEIPVEVLLIEKY